MNHYTSVLKKYATFNGRVTRSEFWFFSLFNTIISIALAVVSVLLSILVDPSFFYLSTLYALALIIPSMAVSVRRLHDTGKSGWWILITLIPFVGAITFIVFTIRDSQSGQNKYGPNPKEGNTVDEPVIYEAPVEQTTSESTVIEGDDDISNTVK
jgi:uncharacterized membrane protein YhaH (DUF805 family)